MKNSKQKFGIKAVRAISETDSSGDKITDSGDEVVADVQSKLPVDEGSGGVNQL